MPTLRPGQLVLADRRRSAVVGDVVIARDPRTSELIVKRLTSIEDGFWLEGDAMRTESAASSSDSWVFGPVSGLVAVVVVPRSTAGPR